MRHATYVVLFILPLAALQTGCASVAMTAVGVGGGMAVSHELNGHASRTFTASLPKVRGGLMVALRRMAIKPERSEKIPGGETIFATTNERRIQIELEALSTNTTRVEAVARSKSGFVDAATALEIVRQAELAFGRPQDRELAAAPRE